MTGSDSESSSSSSGEDSDIEKDEKLSSAIFLQVNITQKFFDFKFYNSSTVIQ